MQPIDNSDLAWLIIADFLADEGKITESEELRDLVNNPETPEDWNYEYPFGVYVKVGGRGVNRIGSMGNSCVGSSTSGNCNHVGVVATGISDRVGSRGRGRVGIQGGGG